MTELARVAVVGATGYSGFELARLLLRHPWTERPVFFLRDAHAGVRCLSELYPQLRGWGEAPCRPYSVPAVKGSGAKTAFLATPPEVSMALGAELLDAGLRVVDLSGAFRFRDPEIFTRWYEMPPAPAGLLDSAVYGLPEIYREALPGAQLIANPGCYATSVILGLRPLLKAGWTDRNSMLVCDCKSGASGAGKEPKREMQFVEVNENFHAYGAFTHRHTPEIAEHLGLSLKDVVFTAHLLPLERGILSTLYVRLSPPRPQEEIAALYTEYYSGQPMVRLHPPGQLPELRHVVHTNFCDIGFAIEPDRERLIIVSCLDNLGKGAAGQAVQNFNAMMGYPETAGLL
jgi:N-acetyl-gamma-glutamyl-phosphate reductase